MRNDPDGVECRFCGDTGRFVVEEFDGRTVVPCICTQNDPHEQARAALAREYTSNPNRQQKRAPIRAPRPS